MLTYRKFFGRHIFDSFAKQSCVRLSTQRWKSKLNGGEQSTSSRPNESSTNQKKEDLLPSSGLTTNQIKGMGIVKHTCKPDDHMQLKDSIVKCLNEGLLPIMHDGTELEGHTFLDGKEVASINVEKMKSNNDDEKILNSIGKNDEEKLDQLLKRLQERIGSDYVFKKETFYNWANNQTSNVISCRPETKDDVSKIIRAARAENVGIRCAGSRHSWAPVFADTFQICVHIENLKSDYTSQTNIRVADLQKRTVDVMAGVTTGDLKTFQLQTKLNLNTNVILDLVQMVSVTQTGCHGVGRDTHCLSDYLVKIRIFDSDGVLRTFCAEGKEAGELFRALSAAFGCFGIVYDITLKMDPEVIVATETSYPKMRETFYSAAKLRDIVENNWAVEMFWFPFNSIPFDFSNDEVWVRTFNKVHFEENKKLADVDYYKKKDMADFLTQGALSVLTPCITNNEGIVPWVQWSSFGGIKNLLYPVGQIYQEIPNAIHFRKHLDLAKVYDMEFVFDYEGDYSKLMEIIQVVVKHVEQFNVKGQYPLNLSLEMRFMTYSDAYLGTGNIANPEYGGSGHVVCIEVLSLKGTKNWAEFSSAIGKEWMELGGVPHMAKQYDHLPNIFEHIRQKMKPQLAAFTKQLENSKVDPAGIFLNKGMRKLLGYK